MLKCLTRLSVALLFASLAFAQRDVYGNMNVFGYVNATASPWTAPFALVTVDPTGPTCPDHLGEVVYNTTSGALSACGTSGWAAISGGGGGMTGPISSTDYNLSAFNGTGGNTLRNTLITTDAAGKIVVPSTASFGSSGAGIINVNSGIIESGSSSNSDGVGELSLSAAKTVSYNWAQVYTSHPEVTLTCQFDCHGNSPWVTYTGVASFTIHFSSSVTGSVSYSAGGRN